MLLIFSTIYFIIPIKFFILVFNFTLSSIWSYTIFSLYMFYKNISYIKKENEQEINLVKQILSIKKDLRSTKEILEEIEKKLKKESF